MCAQCHGDPGELKQPAFSYRPGQPLSDYLDRREAAVGDFVHTANQIQRLALSDCFESSPELECISCHDPHGDERARIQDASDQRCASCHNSEDCGERPRLPNSLRDDCSRCHMPKKATVETTFSTRDDEFVDALRLTEHRIGVHPLASRALVIETLAREQSDADALARLTTLQVESLMSRAREEREQRAFLEAVSFYRQALRLRPQEPNAGRERDEAMQAHQSANQARALAAESLELEQAGDLRTAAARLAEAERLDPDEPDVAYNSGRAAQAMGDFARARDRYERVLAQRPDHLDATNNLATLLAAQGQRREAEAGFRTVLSKRPGHRAATLNLLRLLVEEDRIDEAAGLVDAVTDDPELMVEAADLRLRRDRSGGFALFESALRLDPQRIATRIRFAQALARANRFDEAREELDYSADLAPENREVHRALAALQTERSDFDGAESSYLEALALGPPDFELHLSYGDMLYLAGRLGDALHQFAEARAIAPGRYEAELRLAEALTKTDPKQALEHAKRALECGPGMLRVLKVAAVAYAVNADFDGAIRHAEEAREVAQSQGRQDEVATIDEMLQRFRSLHRRRR